ncbi:hypothetical protein ACFWR6_06970 [Streptomyces griseus]|uniref:hypothetical protein n=1 Tax=Streptomyces griseus TaxID=1911 RepID=UPI003665F8CC
MGAFDWLRGGNDRELASTTYAGRESASDEASRRRRAAHRKRVQRDGDRAGMKPDRRSNWT